MRYPSPTLIRAFVFSCLGLTLLACGDDTNETADCQDAECTAPPSPICSGDLLIERQSTGVCNESGQCEYAAVETDCSGNGGTCVDGQCLGGSELCGGVSCDTPPGAECDGNTAVVYEETGSCAEGDVCAYASSRTDCADNGQVCEGGACVDGPQTCTAADECDNAPADFCDEDGALSSYSSNGECQDGVCVYEPTTSVCETGSTCVEGACVADEIDLCEGIICETPPPALCDEAGDVVTFIDVGVCVEETGECRYAPTRTTCDPGDICLEGSCIADPGPCGGSCSNPPNAPSCNEDGDTVTYAGECNAETTECDYTEVVTPCEEGLSCLSGRCIDPANPCDGIVCEEIPANDCDGNNVQTWTGSCNPTTALCEYSIASSISCEGDLRCDTGACIDRCAATTCEQETDFCADAATAVRFTAPGICDIETGTCDDTPVRTEVTCPDGSVCDGGGFCLRSWAVGDVVISEWLRDPQQGGSDAEWFELANTTSDTLDLRGLIIKDDGSDQFEVTESVIVEPGGVAVFARTDSALGENGTPDFVYGSSMTLSNSEDEIVVLSGEIEIAAIRYGTTSFRNAKGATNSLDPASVTPSDYADPENWCAGFSAYDSVPNRGTPGASNESCTDPCRELTCPASEAFCLDDSTIAVYAASGVCIDGACDYGDDATITACSETQRCAEGVCVDRCSGVVCERETDFCADSTTAVRFSSAGICDSLTGDCDSSSVRTEVICDAEQLCVDDGVCQRNWMAGDLLITEFLASPAQGGSDGEWFEIYNNTGTTVDLLGLTVRDDGSNEFTIATSVVASPSQRLLFARTETAGGVATPDYVYGTSFSLSNTSDQIVLQSNDVEIARLNYVGSDFGGDAGASASLDPAGTDAAGYDVAANWCDGFTVYDENGNKGTPGAPNESCDNPCRSLDCSIRPSTCLNATAPRFATPAPASAIQTRAHATTQPSPPQRSAPQEAPVRAAHVLLMVSAIDPGALVITEVAANFSGNVTSLEWFEVQNTTADTLTLTGLVISDLTGATPAQNQSFTVESNLTVSAGEFVAFETIAGAAGTVAASTYEWGGPTVFRLDAIDQIVLTFNGTEIDRISWDDTDWPAANDYAIQFVGTPESDNNVAASWCLGTNVYAGARFGTRGEANTECAAEGPRGPVPTEIVITEFLANPTIDDTVGEWIEIHNTTGEPLSLQGVLVTALDDVGEPNPADGFVIEVPLVIDPQDYLVLARSADALGLGQAPDFIWNGTYALSNSSEDEIILIYEDSIIDTVVYGPGRTLGNGTGIAASLSSASLSTSLNDDPANWCSASTAFGTGDNGSPGEENPSCAGPILPAPSAGDLVITEVMANSRAGTSDFGEYVEVYHRGSQPISLDGCALLDGNRNAFVDTTPLMPGEYYVIGKTADPQFFGAVVPDIQLGNMGLSNSGDTITISCGVDAEEVIIDSFTFTDGSVVVGQSLQFSLPVSADTSTDNDLLSNWCLTPPELALRYHINDSNSVYGTPGAANRCTADPIEPSDAAVWINEIHYDNASTDENELVEIAGPAGTDVTGWSILLYTGNNGTVYDTFALNGVLLGPGSIGFMVVPTAAIENGSPDGIALVDDTGVVVQFLSYEGFFTATGGPAAGMTSTDIGVSETSSTAAADSLQLTGEGCAYEDFTWLPPSPATPGAANNGQTFFCLIP